MRLGRRQVDVLRAAAAGYSSAWHAGRGRFAVSGMNDVYGDDVLESLLKRELITQGAEQVGGWQVVLTDAGKEALR